MTSPLSNLSTSRPRTLASIIGANDPLTEPLYLNPLTTIATQRIAFQGTIAPTSFDDVNVATVNGLVGAEFGLTGSQRDPRRVATVDLTDPGNSTLVQTMPTSAGVELGAILAALSQRASDSNLNEI